MPSPFPGMNPFLEHPDVWGTFHTRMLAARPIGSRPRFALIILYTWRPTSGSMSGRTITKTAD